MNCAKLLLLSKLSALFEKGGQGDFSIAAIERLFIQSRSISLSKVVNAGMIDDAAVSDFFSPHGHLNHALTDVG